jgi:hypothetical protein
MAATYKDFQRQPSKPHQCMHHSEKDATRCRAASMHNEYMCYQHRADDIPTVIQNDPFLIERLDDRAAIQHAVTQVAARLACNHMDLKRAGLLLQALQIAVTNLSAPPPTLPPSIPDSGPEFAPDPEPDPEPDLESAPPRSEVNDIPTLHAATSESTRSEALPRTADLKPRTWPHDRYSFIHGSVDFISSSVVPLKTMPPSFSMRNFVLSSIP